MRRVTRPGGRVVALEITQMPAPGFPRSSASTSTTWSRGSASWSGATARRYTLPAAVGGSLRDAGASSSALMERSGYGA